jgi:hypothetical protein
MFESPATQAAMVPAHLPHSKCRLNLDAEGHLGFSGQPLGEVNWDLTDSEAKAVGHVGHFYQENVPA